MAFEFDVVKEATFNVLLKRWRCGCQCRLVHNAANCLLLAVGQHFDINSQRPRMPLLLHGALQLRALHLGQLRRVPPEREASNSAPTSATRGTMRRGHGVRRRAAVGYRGDPCTFVGVAAASSAALNSGRGADESRRSMREIDAMFLDARSCNAAGSILL